MPVIELNKKEVFKLVGKILQDDKLKERISMLGTDLDEISNETIKVEIFPNRPDMLSEEGFSRALSSFIGVKKGLRKYNIKKGKYKVKVDNSVKKVRGAVCAAVVKDVVLNEVAVKSLMQLQEKLHTTHGLNRKRVSIGVYDLDTIKFPLLYTTKEKSFRFVPLDMKKELTLLQILSQHPKGRDYASLLEGFEKFPIWIDSNGRVLSMPPIINSEETKIKENTKNLFIDVTGMDQQAVEQALNIIVCSLADRGSKVYSVDFGKNKFPNLNPEPWKLDLNKVNSLLGLNLKKSDIKKYLEMMGHAYDGKNVYVPCYRTNILHQVDLAEDIAIAYGYENFNPEIPNVSTIGEEDEFENFKNKVATLLAGLGFFETNSYNVTNKDIQNKKTNSKNQLIELLNPCSKDNTVLRYWMIPSLLAILTENKHYEYPQSIFEIGNCFKKGKTETFVSEETNLAIALAHQKASFTEIKQIVDYFFVSLGLAYKIEEEKHSSFIDGRVGKIILNGKIAGILGEIHPDVITNFDLEMPVSCAELNLFEIFSALK